MAKHTGSTSWTKNRLTSRLGVQYPIIQGPLGGLSSQRLTAAVSNYGGLGSFGAHGLKPEATRKVNREIKALTPKPFAMNLWVSMENKGAFTSTEEAFHLPWLLWLYFQARGQSIVCPRAHLIRRRTPGCRRLCETQRIAMADLP